MSPHIYWWNIRCKDRKWSPQFILFVCICVLAKRMKWGLYFLSLYLMLCQYVCVKSFCKKKDKVFKTALMTLFILLLRKKCKYRYTNKYYYY